MIRTPPRESTMPHRLTISALLLLVAGLLGCTSPVDGEDEPDGEAATDVATFATDRLSFDYPAQFEIAEQDEGNEQRVRITSPDGGDPADATILAFWPLATSSSLEQTVGFFGPDATSAAVSDFEERSIDIPGASEAIEHRFVATDAVPGETRPIEFVSIYAMAEVGRTLNLVLGVDPESSYDMDALRETVLGSLQLGEATGGESADGEQTAEQDKTALLEGRVQVALPEGWEVDAAGDSVQVRPSGEELPVLSVLRLPAEGLEDLDTVLGELLADAVGEVEREEAVVAGATEAYVVRRETDGGLWQRIVVARADDGPVYAMMLAADAAAAPTPDLVAGLFDSFEIVPDTAPVDA